MGLFDAAPYIGPALSILGGLFGGGPKVNPQATADASTARQYLGQAGGVTTQIGGQAQKYGTLADYAGNNFNTDDPAMRTATQNEIAYLQQDPSTDQADAQYVANATKGRAAAYQGANANLTANLAARGFEGPSSNLTGGLTSLAEAQAASAAGANNALAQHQVAQADANRRGIIGLQQGLDNTDYSRETGALGAQTGALGSEIGDLGNISGKYSSLSQYEQGQQNAQNQQESQLWGGIGSEVGGAIDGGNDTTDAQNALLKAQAGYYKHLTNPDGSIPGIGGAAGASSPLPAGSTGQPSSTGYGFGLSSVFGGNAAAPPPTGYDTGLSSVLGTSSALPADPSQSMMYTPLSSYAQQAGNASAGNNPAVGVSPVTPPAFATSPLSAFGGPSAGPSYSVPPALLSLNTPKARAFVSYYQGGMQGRPPAGMDAGDVQDAVNLYIKNDPEAMANYRKGDLDPLDAQGD